MMNSTESAVFHLKDKLIQKLKDKHFRIDRFGDDHAPFEKFRGNIKFQSKFIFEGHSLSRRDDIVSLIYVLANLIEPTVFDNFHCNSV